METYLRDCLALPCVQFPADFSRQPKEIHIDNKTRSCVNQRIDRVQLWGGHVDDPNAFAIACIAVLVHRRTGDDEFVLAVSYGGNFFPVKFAVEDCSFADFVKSVRNSLNAAETVSGLSGKDALSNATIYVCIDSNGSSSNEVILRNSESAEVLFNLKSETEASIMIEISYLSNLFSEATAKETAEQISQLIQLTSSDSQKSVYKYSLLTKHAERLLPDPFQKLDASWPGSIIKCFDLTSARYPSNTAIVYEDFSLNYEHLSKYIDKLAGYLISKGIKKGDKIALYGHRSPTVVWAIMGILKSGAAYSMIDPKYPFSRISACIEISDYSGWIQMEAAGELSEELSSLLDSLDLKVRESLPKLDSLAFKCNFEYDSSSIKFPELYQEDISVLTFTSGSTGLPKGVLGKHSSLTHFYPWMSERFSLSANDRFSMCSGIAHDPLQRDIFTPLYFGASIYIPTEKEISEPGQLSRWMRKSKISITCLTPAMGQLLTSEVGSENMIPDLRVALFVGDLLIKRDVLRLFSIAENVSLINMYGSTETQRAVGYFDVPRDLSQFKEVIPVGSGMKDVQLLILNKSGEMAGIGEVAEIYVRSPHLAMGYLGLPDQTSQRFLQNPLSSDPVDRIYKTGDLGRYRSQDGVVECAGRADDQIKIRGFRIELGEINAFLSKHSSVKENVTIVREDQPGNKRIVSYVIPLQAVSLSEQREMIASIRKHLKNSLPIYMVPAAIVLLSSMPLTPNGKINKSGLPVPEDVALEDEVNENLTETEETVQSIWSSCLGIKNPGISQNFFDLGGHSLLATRIILELSKRFEVRIPINALFEFPTISELARYIEKLLKDSSFHEASSSRDLFKEIYIPEDVVVKEKFSPGKITRILLTGCTGFLGAFLLRDLLAVSNALIYCAVRAKDTTDGMDRIKKSLSDHLLWNANFADRIVAVPSDMSKPKLGLKDSDWSTLAQDIDAIVHNAALVHWLLPYEKLKPANVEGTVEIIRLAIAKKTKSVHYVSTTSVFDTDYHRNLQVVNESDPLDSFTGLTGGYPQSKWVAEKILQKARSLGVPVKVYRPGYSKQVNQMHFFNCLSSLW
jgi:L-aminoadipate-semialdehyde dehydrogenase